MVDVYMIKNVKEKEIAKMVNVLVLIIVKIIWEKIKIKKSYRKLLVPKPSYYWVKCKKMILQNISKKTIL